VDQAGTMVREVLDDAARERLATNVVGHLLNGVTEPVLVRAFEYWHNVDKNLGDKIEQGVRAHSRRPWNRTLAWRHARYDGGTCCHGCPCSLWPA
jgi:catalase